MKRFLALLLALLLPCCAMAEEPFSTDFTLQFGSANATADARLQGLFDFLDDLYLYGNYTGADDSFHLEAHMRMKVYPDTDLPLTAWGTADTIYVESPLLGDRVLLLDMPSLLAFSRKLDEWLGISTHCAALLLPYVTQHALAPVVSLWDERIAPGLVNRDLTRGQLLDFVEEVKALIATDPELNTWVSVFTQELGLQTRVDWCEAMLAAWANNPYVAENLWDGIDDLTPALQWSEEYQQHILHIYDARGRSLTLFWRDAQFYVVAEERDEAVFSISGNRNQPETDTYTSWHLTLQGSEFSAVPVPLFRDQVLCFEAGHDRLSLLVYSEPDFLSLFAPGDAGNHYYLVLQCMYLLDTATPSTVLKGEPARPIDLFSLDEAAFRSLLADIAAPLLKNGLSFLAETPASTLAALMDILEEADFFQLDRGMNGN